LEKEEVKFFFFSLRRRFFPLTENQRRDAGDDSQFRQTQTKETTADNILRV